MPTVFRSGPYRFYFYSNEGHEPPHVHVDRDRATIKFWLDPIEIALNRGFSRVEAATIEAVVIGNADIILEAWNEHFA